MHLAKKIAEELELGLKVFLNINKRDILVIPDFNDFDENIKLWENEISELRMNPQNWTEITKWTSKEEFEFMQHFVNHDVDDKQLQGELSFILQNSKPFRNFKFLIENNEIYRQKWFAFITEKREKYIEKLLQNTYKNGFR